ncbi:cysteine synthase A [Deinococcus sp.]|uniref:cysteine synthase A n=1 Tax=Deinococcus sp. TaxID=47478 RepID=UPI0025C57122|nr:cysteine synthase A [Deinococcus sp.]
MIESFIGHTPIAQLKRLAGPDMADVFIKLEGQNPGGSIKDRTALGLIEDAEARGVLRPGGTIIEPTSGNTGIGLAQIAAARGYKLILCMPAQMSEERKRTLKAYGAQLVLTDPVRRMAAAIEEAERLAAETGGVVMGQFTNPANPAVHERTTGPELWEQMEGRIDAFVYGSGTGGTISGVGRFLKRQNPDIQVIACEPARSNVISGGERGEHGFQGMGPGFIPGNLDLSVLDGVIQVWEEDAYPLARQLAEQEGIFVGMSSGAMAWAALEVARRLGPGKRVLTIACDTGARYLTTALFDGGQDTPKGYKVRSRELLVEVDS